MTLKAMYEKQEDIPENLRTEYVERDGKWVLDAEGMAPAAELANLKSKIAEFRTTNVDLAKKLEKFEGKKVLTEEEQEEFDRLMQQERDQRDKKLIDSGKIDELLANRTEKMREDYENRIGQLKEGLTSAEERAQSQEQRLSKVLIRSEVTQLLSDQGIQPVKGAMEDIFARAGSVWRVDKDGKLIAQKENGETVYGPKGEPLTLQEWGQNIVKDAPYLFDSNRGADGQGSKQKNQGGNDGVIRIPRSDERLKSKHVDDIATGKAVIVDG